MLVRTFNRAWVVQQPAETISALSLLAIDKEVVLAAATNPKISLLRDLIDKLMQLLASKPRSGLLFQHWKPTYTPEYSCALPVAFAVDQHHVSLCSVCRIQFELLKLSRQHM